MHGRTISTVGLRSRPVNRLAEAMCVDADMAWYGSLHRAEGGTRPGLMAGSNLYKGIAQSCDTGQRWGRRGHWHGIKCYMWLSLRFYMTMGTALREDE